MGLVSESHPRLSDEVDGGSLRNDAALVAHVEELANRRAAVVAIVDGPLVHIHADEAVGEIGIEVARELHRVLQRSFAMIPRVLNALPQRVCGDELNIATQRTADGVATERQRKPGLLEPPDTQVKDLRQAVAAGGELTLVNDQACVKLTREDRRNDLVEWHGDRLNVRGKELQ